MLLVRLTSRGPAIYTQTRVGRGGRVFTLYKIRTMYHDCERQTGPRWSAAGDPRITPVGRVLRKLHLDELPQLLNVLRGEMSLIGPRPERPEIVAKLRRVGARLRPPARGQAGHHRVRPGPPAAGHVRAQREEQARLRPLLHPPPLGPGWNCSSSCATGLKLVGLKKLYQRKPRIPTE